MTLRQVMVTAFKMNVGMRRKETSTPGEILPERTLWRRHVCTCERKQHPDAENSGDIQ